MRSATGHGRLQFIGKLIARVGANKFSYILQMNVIDHSGSFWITGFNEVAEQVMSISANDLQKLKVSLLLHSDAY